MKIISTLNLFVYTPNRFVNFTINELISFKWTASKRETEIVFSCKMYSILFVLFIVKGLLFVQLFLQLIQKKKKKKKKNILWVAKILLGSWCPAV